MDLNARVDVNCGRKDGRTDGLTDGRTENRTPISHLTKEGATKIPRIQLSLSKRLRGYPKDFTKIKKKKKTKKNT